MMNIHKELPLSFPGCPPSPDPSPPFTQISRHYHPYNSSCLIVNDLADGLAYPRLPDDTLDCGSSTVGVIDAAGFPSNADQFTMIILEDERWAIGWRECTTIIFNGVPLPTTCAFRNLSGSGLSLSDPFGRCDSASCGVVGLGGVQGTFIEGVLNPTEDRYFVELRLLSPFTIAINLDSDVEAENAALHIFFQTIGEETLLHGEFPCTTLFPGDLSFFCG